MSAVAVSLPKRRARLPKTLIGGGAIILASLALAFFPHLFAPYDPLAFDYTAIMAPPSLAHPFGTDNFGRDGL